MQWPSAKSDLHYFDKVIRQCPTFLSVCPSVGAVGSQRKLSGVDELSKKDKKMIPYFRVWCLFEIFHAATLKKQQEKRPRSHFSDRFLSIDLLDDNQGIGRRLVVGDNLHYEYEIRDIEMTPVQGSVHRQTLTILFKTGSSCECAPDGSHTFKVDKKMLADLIN